MAVIPYLKAHRPFCIGTWTLRVRVAGEQEFPNGPLFVSMFVSDISIFPVEGALYIGNLMIEFGVLVALVCVVCLSRHARAGLSSIELCSSLKLERGYRMNSAGVQRF